MQAHASEIGIGQIPASPKHAPTPLRLARFRLTIISTSRDLEALVRKGFRLRLQALRLALAIGIDSYYDTSQWSFTSHLGSTAF